MGHGIEVRRGQYHQNWKVGRRGGEDDVVPNGTSERDWAVVAVPAIEHGLYVSREALAVVNSFRVKSVLDNWPRRVESSTYARNSTNRK